MAIIEVNHVTKEFQLGALHGFSQTLQNSFARLRGQPPKQRPLFKALDDVDFTVAEGEVLGIIGHNGAGKSTLLKLLANITSPTHGNVNVRGKVAPLIEVGAGLVGDLTGRENIYLNGAILGIPRAEITRKFDDIVAFAELENFVDTPIKRFSSGMAVRLGFAVATSVDADILIVDEVLAVGDLAFQRRCFDRMEEIIKRQGRTVLLVSHNIRQVARLCTRAIQLDHGNVILDGSPAEVCNHFYQTSNKKIHDDALTAQQSKRTVISSGEAELQTVEIVGKEGNSVDKINVGAELKIRIRFVLHAPLSKPEFHVGTHTTDFIYLTGSSSAVLENRTDLNAGNHELICTLPSYPLVPGVYCIRFTIFDQFRRKVFQGETLQIFSVDADFTETNQDELRLIEVPTLWELDGINLCAKQNKLIS